MGDGTRHALQPRPAEHQPDGRVDGVPRRQVVTGEVGALHGGPADEQHPGGPGDGDVEQPVVLLRRVDADAAAEVLGLLDVVGRVGDGRGVEHGAPVMSSGPVARSPRRSEE